MEVNLTQSSDELEYYDAPQGKLQLEVEKRYQIKRNRLTGVKVRGSARSRSTPALRKQIHGGTDSGFTSFSHRDRCGGSDED